MGTSEEKFNKSASNWDVRIVPEAPGTATGNTINFQAKFREGGGTDATFNVTWSTCIDLYKISYEGP